VDRTQISLAIEQAEKILEEIPAYQYDGGYNTHPNKFFVDIWENQTEVNNFFDALNRAREIFDSLAPEQSDIDNAVSVLQSEAENYKLLAQYGHAEFMVNNDENLATSDIYTAIDMAVDSGQFEKTITLLSDTWFGDGDLGGLLAQNEIEIIVPSGITLTIWDDNIEFFNLTNFGRIDLNDATFPQNTKLTNEGIIFAYNATFIDADIVNEPNGMLIFSGEFNMSRDSVQPTITNRGTMNFSGGSVTWSEESDLSITGATVNNYGYLNFSQHGENDFAQTSIENHIGGIMNFEFGRFRNLQGGAILNSGVISVENENISSDTPFNFVGMSERASIIAFGELRDENGNQIVSPHLFQIIDADGEPLLFDVAGGFVPIGTFMWQNDSWQQVMAGRANNIFYRTANELFANAGAWPFTLTNNAFFNDSSVSPANLRGGMDTGNFNIGLTFIVKADLFPIQLSVQANSTMVLKKDCRLEVIGSGASSYFTNIGRFIIEEDAEFKTARPFENTTGRIHVHNRGSLVIEGEFENYANPSISTTGVITVEENGWLFLNGEAVNNGRINMRGYFQNEGGNFTNNVTVVFENIGGNHGYEQAANSSFVNNGTIEFVSPGSRMMFRGGDFTNNATGTIILNRGADFARAGGDIYNAGTIKLAHGVNSGDPPFVAPFVAGGGRHHMLTHVDPNGYGTIEILSPILESENVLDFSLFFESDEEFVGHYTGILPVGVYRYRSGTMEIFIRE
ncbi:MAG: hypothetical protein FWD19_02560, partial [Defluviitaleaceae bacterium]|nr:hypothetical protein [Defluviitaleaceae bacterium]